MKTNVYIDGFNLFHGCLQHTPYKWLDVQKLCEWHFPKNQINQIRFFTAQVKPRPSNPDQLVHQGTYWRALRTLPQLSIHEGRFQSHSCRMPRTNPISGQPKTVEVIRTDEKGSDVNLAAHLLVDAYKKDCDVAIIVSNDSDLMTPIFMARKEFGIRVGVLHPLRRNIVSYSGRYPLQLASLPHASNDLKRTGAFRKEVDEAALIACQFAPTLSDANGTITKPVAW